jgi:carbonic anhydrase
MKCSWLSINRDGGGNQERLYEENMKKTIYTTRALACALLLAQHGTAAHISGGDVVTAPSSTTVDTAVTLLRNGNARFVQGRMSHGDDVKIARVKLLQGQSPATAVLSCSDSRVPPEEVFDQGLGKIFVVRVAGNVVSQEGLASLEYAVAHLGTKLIVVMGHSSCGAVQATLETGNGKSLGSTALDILAGEIRPSLRAVGLPSALDESIKENARAGVRNLRKSPILSAALDKGSIKAIAAIYQLDSGRVDFLSEDQNSKR